MILNRVMRVILEIREYRLDNRDVNRTEISGPARKFFGLAWPGPESMYEYYKICKMVYKYYCILELYTLEK